MTHGGAALRLSRSLFAHAWAQSPVGVTSGKHWFSVTVMRSLYGRVHVGALRTDESEYGPGDSSSPASGAKFQPYGRFWFGTAPLSADQSNRRQRRMR